MAQTVPVRTAADASAQQRTAAPTNEGGAPQRPLTYGERQTMLLKAACDRKLQAFSLRVLIVMNDHYNHKQGLAWPGQERIAKLLDSPRQAVTRAVKELEDRGYITSFKVGRMRRYRFSEPLMADFNLREPATPVLPIDEKPEEQQATRVLPVRETHTLPIPATPMLPQPVYVEPESLNQEQTPSSSVHTTSDSAESPVVVSAAEKPKPITCPGDFTPPPDKVARAISELGLDAALVEQESEDFLDYFTQNEKGRKTKWTYWDRVWWKWMRRVAERQSRHRAPQARNSNKGPAYDAPLPTDWAGKNGVTYGGTTIIADAHVPRTPAEIAKRQHKRQEQAARIAAFKQREGIRVSGS